MSYYQPPGLPPGYTAVGRRRTMQIGGQMATTGTGKGATSFFKLLHPIFIHDLYVNHSAIVLPTGLPLANTSFQILYVVAWATTDTLANLQQPAFAPTIQNEPQDGSFDPAQTRNVGNANSPFGPAGANPGTPIPVRDWLYSDIMSGWVLTTGPVGGPYSRGARVKLEQLIPEGAFLSIHADEVQDTSMSLVVELITNWTYTPLRGSPSELKL